jgi:hypothetical protein
MKININIDLTPDEAKDLFIPSEKQAEFLAALTKAYTEAITKVVVAAYDGTVGKIF